MYLFWIRWFDENSSLLTARICLANARIVTETYENRQICTNYLNTFDIYILFCNEIKSYNYH